MMEVLAEVVWLPSVKNHSVEAHFRDLLGIDLLIESVHLSEKEEESYITIFGKLKIQKSGIKLLVNRWCGQEVRKHQMYLSLEKAMVLENINHTLDDKWLAVENMSFGTMVELNKFAEHYSVMEQNTNKELAFKVANINVYFQHDVKLMSVYFHVVEKAVGAKEGNAATHRPHRFEYEYSAIEKVLINTTVESKSIDVYFYISHPPLIYIVEQPEDAEIRQYENYIYQSPDTTYRRVDTFADCPSSDIGFSTVLKLRFSSGNSWDAIFNFLLNSERIKYYFSPILILPPKKGNYQSPKIKEDQFNCTYALQTVLSRSREVVIQINEKLEILAVNENLNNFAKENHKALEVALYDIFRLFERKKLVHFNKALEILYEKHKKILSGNINDNNNKNTNNSPSIPENMTEVRRAVLTPTRIIFLPPQPYFKCCFFREFEPEYAIRLSVKDDNIASLSFTLFGRPKSEQHDNPKTTIPSSLENANHLDEENEKEDDLYKINPALKKVKDRLLRGFRVGGRHYEWLGCSTSHFREHGVLYYAKDSKNRNAAEARRKMGNFDKIKNVPSKYMARLGQVFSQSLDFITVDKSETVVKDDITTIRPNSDKPYIFSDGIGKIPPSIAHKVFKKMKINHNPSAIQIRYAGCKGMLTQWSELDDKIVFRESMKKFESCSEYLDVLKVSKPRLVYLNRPFISILSQLGVPDEVFLDLQNYNLELYLNSLAYRKDATSTLYVHSALRVVDYKKIHDAGINVLEEPFFCSMIRSIFQHHLVKLTKKARIQIPVDKGRTMFGVLDETKTLEYGQVFVQYTKDIHKEEESAETVILNDQMVLVTKNPCMHPGDVRKFLAMDVEALRHIKDCIVFPAKGPRPHPDEMAGSDLDGDEYSVIWAKELIFSCDNHDPMDFPEDEPKLKKETGVEEMVDFFCSYIRAGQVGQIATAHLVLAEYEEGIFSQKCKDLALKYSVALDFAKSGNPEHLKRNERPTIYPDYLEKGLLNDTYISKTILGQLYRSSKTLLLGFEGLIYTSISELDEDLIYPGHENYKDDAKDELSAFNQEVDAILQQYGIESEGELFSGAILKTSKYTCVKQDLNDLTAIEYRIKNLFEETQKKFCRGLLGPDIRERSPLRMLVSSEKREQVFQKASAWYVVAHEQPENEKKYFGFPWTIDMILCKLKEERVKLNSSSPNGEKNGNKTVGMSKSAVFKLDAFKEINDWMGKQPIITNNSEDKEYYDYLMTEIFNEVADDLKKEDTTEELSVPKIALIYLHKLSRLIFRRDFYRRRSHHSHFLQEQIIGLLAFKALLNQVHRKTFGDASLIESDMKSVRGVFRIPLDDDDIFLCISHKRKEFIELLKEWTKVEEVKLRLKPDRGNKWLILFTVKGNKYTLHHFQDVIFQSSFQKAAKRIL